MTHPTYDTLTDTKAIKHWIENRSGFPARIAYDSTGKPLDPLTIRFPDEERDVKQSFQRLDWEEFFALLKEYELALECRPNDKNDRYFRFVKKN